MVTSRRAALLPLICFLFVSPAGAPGRPGTEFTILLSNDDGYDAPGLRALSESLQSIGEIVVAAPTAEQSGKGQSITIREAIMASEKKQPNGTVWYAIDGPPATCVRLAVESLMPRKPDLVVSGINRGENLGSSVNISGTLGAAREAAGVGLPAMAVSIQGDDEKDYAAAAAFVRQLVEKLREKQMLKSGLFLNVNVPAGERKGVRWARLSQKPGDVRFERRTNPGGRLYFWQVFRQIQEDAEDTDVWTFFHGYIAVTPMALDVTALQVIENLRVLDLRLPDSPPPE